MVKTLLLLPFLSAAMLIFGHILFPSHPKLPGDIYIYKFGVEIYIPVLTPLVLSFLIGGALIYFKVPF